MYDFDYGNYCIVVQLENCKFLMGSFIDEKSVIGLNRKRNEAMVVEDNDKDNNKDDDAIMFPFTKIQCDIIRSIFIDLNFIIIPNFNSMLGLPFILSKFNINLNNENNSIQLLTTEPLIQLSQCYMEEFYTNFNSFLISNNSNIDVPITLITMNDITNCLNSFIHLSHNERYNSLTKIKGIDHSIIISFKSSGYELGSFNLLIEYFNKKIFILNQSSLYSHRYPLDFNKEMIEECDLLIQFPHIVNSNSNFSYEKNISKFINEINSIAGKSSINSAHYPYIFLIVEPWFMLEFIDIIRHSFLKEIKVIYISKSIDSMLKYSNINLNFINDRIYHKIYEFKHPFSYEELEKNDTFTSFITFEQMMSSAKLQKVFNGITGSECPILFIVNRIGFECKENNVKNVYEFFRIGMGKENDYIIRMNYDGNVEYEGDCGNVKDIIIDYRMTREQYKGLLGMIKPKEICVNDNIEEDKEEEEMLKGKCYRKYKMNEGNVIDFNRNELVYSNAYTTMELRKSENISLSSYIENMKIFLSKPKKGNSSNNNKEIESGNNDIQMINNTTNQIDYFENLLKIYLNSNNMEITECLCKENILNITISKSSYNSNMNTITNITSSSSSEITITITNNENEPQIEILTENYNDALYLNTILSSIL